jgi:three-Cys-motif partner protein
MTRLFVDSCEVSHKPQYPAGVVTENAEHFEEFHGQTRLKHFILESYLETWARISLQQGAHPAAWFIDAFAGEGKDEHGNAGSPIIACRVSRRLAGYLAERLPAPVPQLNIVAIEHRKKTFDALKAATLAFTQSVGGNCLQLRKGKLEQFLEEIMAMGLMGDPKLFFLDPFGVQGLDASVVQKVLQRPKYEVLALFCDSGAVRLDAAAQAQTRQRSARSSVPGSQNGDLFDDLGLAIPASPIFTNLASDDPSEFPATEVILRAAFADRFEGARRAVEMSLTNGRRATWMREYVAALRAWGASHVLSFSVVDEREHHKYYLIHAAKNAKAISAMKDAIRSATNQRARQPGHQTAMLYASTVNVKDVLAATAKHFAGQAVRWHEVNNIHTVQQFLLRETDALHSDLPLIKTALREKGWLVAAKPATYRFPNQLSN